MARQSMEAALEGIAGLDGRADPCAGLPITSSNENPEDRSHGC